MSASETSSSLRRERSVQRSVETARRAARFTDFEAMVQSFERAGGDPSLLRSLKVARLVISGSRVLGAIEVTGVHVEAQEFDCGVRVKVFVEPGVRLEKPAHLCFGVIPTEGVQAILPEFEIGEGARWR